MPQSLLTDLNLRTAKPAAKPYKLSDGGGLFLLVKPTGAKAWRWKFRLAGKEGLFAVGSSQEGACRGVRCAGRAAGGRPLD